MFLVTTLKYTIYCMSDESNPIKDKFLDSQIADLQIGRPSVNIPICHPTIGRPSVNIPICHPT